MHRSTVSQFKICALLKIPACITIITQEERTDRKEENDKLEIVKKENEGLEELERDKVGIEDVDVEQFLEENTKRKQHLQEQCAKEQLQSMIYFMSFRRVLRISMHCMGGSIYLKKLTIILRAEI